MEERLFLKLLKFSFPGIVNCIAGLLPEVSAIEITPPASRFQNALPLKIVKISGTKPKWRPEYRILTAFSPQSN